jgi:rubredoxin
MQRRHPCEHLPHYPSYTDICPGCGVAHTTSKQKWIDEVSIEVWMCPLCGFMFVKDIEIN